MVFVPDLALTRDAVGLGTGLPRAVPSDALVAVLDELVPGQVLQKLVLVAALGLAGEGVRRLVAQLPTGAALAAVTAAVWNPYVTERLVIGHWPLLLGYAALPWVMRIAAGPWAGRLPPPALVLWLALGATSAAGGLMTGAATLLVALAGPGVRATRAAGAAAATLLVNAPWLVAGLVRASAATGERVGVEVFAARADGVLPLPLTLLGLGGVWNAEVVPATRDGVLPVAALVVTLGLGALGVRGIARAVGGPVLAAYTCCAVLAVGLGLAGSLAPAPLTWLVGHVPGTGLLRDGSRYLGLLAIPLAVAVGHGTARLFALVRNRVAAGSLVVGAVLAPVALLPDLAWGAAGRLTPVDYPADWAAGRAALVTEDPPGDVLLLPWGAFRAPSWNDGRTVLDPLRRYLPRDSVADDRLTVSGRVVPGEDPRAAAVTALLARGEGEEVAPDLAALGIGVVVSDRAAGGPAADALGGRVLHDGPLLAIATLSDPAPLRPAPGEVVIVTLGWLAALIVVVLATGFGVRRTGHAPVGSAAGNVRGRESS